MALFSRGLNSGCHKKSRNDPGSLKKSRSVILPVAFHSQDPANSTTGKANGGEVMYSEEEAEVKIVDPARKPQLPGRYVHRVPRIRRRYNMEIGFPFSTSRTLCGTVL